MERGACAPLKMRCCCRGAFYMRPCSLRQVPRADIESAPTVCFLALAKAPHFLLLSFIYYLLIFPFCKAIFEKRAADFTISNPFCSLNSLKLSDSQALTALRTAAGDDLAAILGSHAVQETVDAAALTLLGLEVRFIFIPPVEIPVWAVCSGLRPYTGAALQS